MSDTQDTAPLPASVATGFPPRLTRVEVSRYLAEIHGIRLTPRSIESAPIPYLLVKGKALYTPADADEYAAAALASASRRIGRPQKPLQSRTMARMMGVGVSEREPGATAPVGNRTAA
jgi:hypothetical protein